MWTALNYRPIVTKNEGIWRERKRCPVCNNNGMPTELAKIYTKTYCGLYVYGKAIPVQARTALRVPGSRGLLYQHNRHLKLLCLSTICTGRLYPREIFLVLISVRGWECHRKDLSMKNSTDTIGYRTRDLAACGALPDPTMLPPARVCT